MKHEKDLPSNKEIFVTALSVLLIFLCGYTVNIQEHRADVADLKNKVKKLQLENYQYKRDYAILEKVNMDICTMDKDKIAKKLDSQFIK